MRTVRTYFLLLKIFNTEELIDSAGKKGLSSEVRTLRRQEMKSRTQQKAWFWVAGDFNFAY